VRSSPADDSECPTSFVASDLYGRTRGRQLYNNSQTIIIVVYSQLKTRNSPGEERAERDIDAIRYQNPIRAHPKGFNVVPLDSTDTISY